MALQLKDRIVQTEHGIKVLEKELNQLRRKEAQESFINPYLAYKYAYEALIERYDSDESNPLPLTTPTYVTAGQYYTDGMKVYFCMHSGAIAEANEEYLKEVE